MFYDHCRYNMSFVELPDVLLREYDSDACRLAVQSELKIQAIKMFMTNLNITDDATELTEIVKHIGSFTPHFPLSFRTKINKIRLKVTLFWWNHGPTRQSEI